MAKKEEKITEVIQIPHVGEATANKLKEAGFHDLMSIAVTSPGQLVDVAAIGESAAKKIINAARNNLDMGFMSGNELVEQRKKIKKISTGSKAIDELVGGGFETGTITSCYGQFGSGKTQIAYQLALNAGLSEEDGGLDGVVVWIDSEKSFVPERIIQMANERELDADKALANIKYVRVYNTDHQMMAVDKIKDMISEGTNVKLIIVDSIMSLFRIDFQARGELAPRQQKLNKHLHTLMKLADIYNICVYATNQVMARPDSFFGDPITPIGGLVLSHSLKTILYLRRGKAGTRVCKLVDSCFLEDGECVFILTSKGVEDIK